MIELMLSPQRQPRLPDEEIWANRMCEPGLL